MTPLPSSILPYHPHQPSRYQNIPRRSHGDIVELGVLGMEHYGIVLFEKPLERGFAVDDRDDNIAVRGVLLLLDDSYIAVKNADVAHAFTLDPQRKKPVALEQRAVERDGPLDVFLGDNGHSGGDPSDDRHLDAVFIGDPAELHDKLDPARLALIDP